MTRFTPRSCKTLVLAAGIAFSVALGFSAQSPANAQQPGEAVHLSATGPVSSPTNFPLWFQDRNGVALQLCTANNDLLGQCPFAPPDLADPYQATIGFADEAFWWLGSASLAIAPSPGCATCRRALLDLGVEAAFNTAPAMGDEFTFGRIRLRIDIPFAGRYRITHPFGQQTIQVDAPGVKAINITDDIGTAAPDYSGPLKSHVGAFLVWDPAVAPAPPAGYVGDLLVPHPVVGATFLDPATNLPFNKFRIEYLDGPVNLDGAGHNFLETADFTISGLKFDGVTPTPLSAVRATYSDGRVEVIAESAPAASVSVAYDHAPSSQYIKGDTLGNFYTAQPMTIMPKVVAITADNSGNSTTTVNATVTDLVWIGAAQYDPAINGGTVTVTATSSNPGINPTLTLLGFGNEVFGTINPTTGSLTVTNVATAPAWVQVNSSLGGTSRATIRIMNAGGLGTAPNAPPAGTPTGARPTGVADTATAPVLTPVVINVAANDKAPVGRTLNLASILVTTPPTRGTIGLIGAGGITYTPNASFIVQIPPVLDTFKYTIKDDTGAVSDPILVTVGVSDVQIGITLDQFTTKDSSWRIRGSAPANSTITAYFTTPAAAVTTPPTCVPGTVIGSGLTDASGAFDIRVVGPRPAVGTLVCATNNKSATSPVVPVTTK
jgi:hypothetical protein